MKLIDVLWLIPETNFVDIIDKDYNVISFYDGHNSIDEKLNNFEVLEIDATGIKYLIIMIDFDANLI